MLDALARAVEDFDDDQVELFRRVARERPHGFIELAEGISFGRVGDQPAMRLPNGWVIYPDEQGELLAIEQSTGRAARVIDGELKPLKLPTPEEIVLN